MDAGIAQGVVYPRVSEYREVVEARDVGKITFVGFHTGYVGRSFLEQGHPVGYALLKYRADNLVNYIIKECSAGDIYSSFRAAFDRMDEELKRMVEKGSWEKMPVCEKALWETGYNSLVAAIDHEKNEIVVGGANVGWLSHILIARQGKEYSLSDLHFLGDTVIRHHKFKSTDDYLIVASLHLWDYIDQANACFVRVLESRVPEVGLEEACRSMVGLYPDQPKSIVAVPLNRKRPHEHERKRQHLEDEDECESEVDGATCMEEQDHSESADDAQRGGYCEEDKQDDRAPWVLKEDDDYGVPWEESNWLPWGNGERPLDPKTSVWYSLLLDADPYPGISRDPSHWGKKRTASAETIKGVPSWAVGSIWQLIAPDLVAQATRTSNGPVDKFHTNVNLQEYKV